MTMKLIQTVTVGAGGAASISFTSIPQDGTDLMITSSLRDNSTSSFVAGFISINSSTTGFSSRVLYGSGTTANSSTQSSNLIFVTNGDTSTANTFHSSQMYIANYTNNAVKTISTETVAENNTTGTEMYLFATSYSGTSPITALSIIATTGKLWKENSTISLYKITKGSDGATVVS